MKLVRCAGRCIGSPANDEINEISKSWMNISRAFSRKRKENIGREFVVFRIIHKLGVVSNLSGMRVSSLIAGAGRGENKVTKHWAMGFMS